jgi:hypothetical protein
MILVADHDAIVRLEEQFRASIAMTEKRFDALEAHALHADACVDETKAKVQEVYDSLLIFRDPLAWSKRNWLPLAIVVLATAFLMSGSTQAVAKAVEVVVKLFAQ